MYSHQAFHRKKCGFKNLKVTVIEKVKIKTVENLENREAHWQRQLFTLRPNGMIVRKEFERGLTKHFLGINPIISGANTPLRKFVGDIGYHFSLSSTVLFSDALHCVGLLLTVLCIHSHIIFIVSFIFSRFQSLETILSLFPSEFP